MKRFSYFAIVLLALASCSKPEGQSKEPDGPSGSEGNDSVTGVTLSAKHIDLSIGKTFQLEATVEPSTAANKQVLWTSSDEGVATVKAGLVTATGDGSATITVTTIDGLKEATCQVEVNTIYVSNISFPQSSVTLVIGGEFQLSPTISPDNAENAAIGYSVTSGSAVTVSSDGLVKAVKVGSATVRASALDGKGAKADVNFTVQSEPIYASSFTIECDTEVQAGKTLTAKINWSPAGTNQKEFTVNSTNTSVATVSGSSGDTFTIKAIKEGTSTIKVHYDSKTGVSDKSFTLYVHSGAPSIAWSCDWKASYGTVGSSATPMVPGETYQLKAAVSNLNNTGVTYSITSGSSYATLSSSGLLTAKAKGTVKVVAASAANPSVKTAEQTIEITYPADKIASASGSTSGSYWENGSDMTYYVKRGSSVTVYFAVQSSAGYTSRQTLEVSSISSSISSIVKITQYSSSSSKVGFTISANTGSYAVKGSATFRVTGTSKTRTVNVYVCEYESSDIKPGDGVYLNQYSSSVSYHGQPAFKDGHYRGKTSGGEMIWYQNQKGEYNSNHAVVTWTGTPGESDSKVRDWATSGGTFNCKDNRSVHGYAVAINNAYSTSTTWAKETQDLFESGASFITGSGNYRGCSVSKANALSLTKKYGYDLTLGGLAYNYNRGDSHHISVIHHLYKCDRSSSDGNSGYTAFNDTYISLPMSLSPKSDASSWYNWYTSGWFLPSEAEWKDCILGFFGMATLNEIISTNKGTSILSTTPYWTMQQNPSDKTQVRAVSGTNGAGGSYLSKTSAYALVRPIIVF